MSVSTIKNFIIISNLTLQNPKREVIGMTASNNLNPLDRDEKY